MGSVSSPFCFPLRHCRGTWPSSGAKSTWRRRLRQRSKWYVCFSIIDYPPEFSLCYSQTYYVAPDSQHIDPNGLDNVHPLATPHISLHGPQQERWQCSATATREAEGGHLSVRHLLSPGVYRISTCNNGWDGAGRSGLGTRLSPTRSPCWGRRETGELIPSEHTTGSLPIRFNF